MSGQKYPSKQAGWRIGIVGTGGQGVLTAAKLLCAAFVERGHEVVSGQLHSMAQRGGCVQSSVMIDCGISTVIAQGSADFVLGFEPVETARALPIMAPKTTVFMNTTPVIPYVLGQKTVQQQEEAKYPQIDLLAEHIREVTQKLTLFDATAAATRAGSSKSLNMLMIGCLLGTDALPCSASEFWDSVTRVVPPKLIETNKKAFLGGVQMGRKHLCTGSGT